MKKSKRLKYKDAGVDIEAQDQALKKVKKIIKSTYSPSVLTEIGPFASLYSINGKKYQSPVLVSTVDGVGTKLKVAFMTGIHNTIGLDLVNHCINDLFVHGAKPLFFLDYIACGKLEPSILEKIMEGMVLGCREAGCALIGGEMAEMPDFYQPGEYDMAGFACGIIERNKLIDGKDIKEGDFIIGLKSSGLHTNGYSLVRKIIFEIQKMSVDTYVEEFGRTIGEELLEPHRSYYRLLKSVISKGLIKGMAHITGGGLMDNVPRILPRGLSAKIRIGSWHVPNIFSYLQAVGHISQREMFRTFNMGIGMVVVIAPDSYNPFLEKMKQAREEIFLIGEIIKGSRKIILT